MSDSAETIVRLPRPLSDYFALEGSVASTVSAQAFKAVDKQQRASVGLWVSREPLAIEDIAAFEERVRALSDVKGVIPISSFGVDSQGTAFVVCEVFSGQDLRGNPKAEFDLTERERRFISCLRTVDRVHQAGLVCEDLCLDSFRINRGGAANLMSVIGVPASLREKGLGSAEPEHARFLSPNLQGEGLINQRGDVYALAVLGIRVFSGRLPEPGGQIPRLGANVPSWVEGVLSPILVQPLSQAPESAAALLARINAWKESEASNATTPVVRDEVKPQRERAQSLTATPQAVTIQYKGSAAKGVGRRRSRSIRIATLQRLRTLSRLHMGIGIAVFLVVILAVVSFTTGSDPKPVIEDTIRRPQSTGVSEAVIAELVRSDDPLAHDSLMRHFRAEENERALRAVFDGIITRARRLGRMRSADLVKSWHRSLGDRGREYEVVAPWLRLIDPALPPEEQVTTLRSLSGQNQRLGTKMAAALAFDTGSLEPFHDALVSVAREQLQIEDAQNRSPLALMLVIPELTPLYLEDVMSSASKIPDGDIPWLLRHLVRRGSLQSIAITEMALARKLVPNEGITFLNLLRKNPNAPPEVRQALVECAFGSVTKENLAPFTRWYEADAERVLYAIILSTKDDEVKQAAFDTLALKPMTNKIISKIVEYSRANMQESRGAVAQLAAVIALQNSVTKEEIEAAFDRIQKIEKPKGLVKILLSEGSPEVVEETTKRFASLLDVPALLELLKHPQKSVRMMAVRGLKDNSNIGAIAILIDAYNHEKDPDVRALYESEVDAIKERKSGKAGGF